MPVWNFQIGRLFFVVLVRWRIHVLMSLLFFECQDHVFIFEILVIKLNYFFLLLFFHRIESPSMFESFRLRKKVCNEECPSKCFGLVQILL